MMIIEKIDFRRQIAWPCLAIDPTSPPAESALGGSDFIMDMITPREKHPSDSPLMGTITVLSLIDQTA